MENLGAEDLARAEQLIEDKLCFLEAAERLTIGVDLLEPLIYDLVDRISLLDAAGADTSRFLEQMTKDVGLASMYVLQVYAHTTRAAWLRVAVASARQGEADFRKRELYDGILEAFEDDWRDRDLFSRFDNTQPSD